MSAVAIFAIALGYAIAGVALGSYTHGRMGRSKPITSDGLTACVLVGIFWPIVILSTPAYLLLFYTGMVANRLGRRRPAPKLPEARAVTPQAHATKQGTR